MNRRVVVSGMDDIVIESEPPPRPAPGEVLIASRLVGICGSDTHAAHGRHPFIDLPYMPGHEVIGDVVELGEGTPEELRGRRVVVEPNLPCGQCELCAVGRYNICEKLQVFGCQTPGGLTDCFAMSHHRIIPLPDSLPDTSAVLIEPMSTPVRAVRAAGDLVGQRVMVIGAGPIGLFTAIAARAAGAGVITVGDLQASKRQRATRLVADASFDPRDEDVSEQVEAALGGAPQVVFDAVSAESTLRLGIRSLAKGGTLVTIGVPAGPMTLDLQLVQDRELRVLGSLMFVREDVERAIEILAAEPFPIDEVVTATFPLERAAEAFRAADDPEQFKVVIDVGGSAQGR